MTGATFCRATGELTREIAQMRIGAILASGGCRARRWTAMSGVALALGAGQAAAQTFTVDESFGDDGVTIVAAAAEGEEMPVTVTVRAKVDPPADPADDQAGGRTVRVYLQARLFNPGEDGYDAQNQAEDSDYAFHEAESERKIEFPSDTDGQFVEVSTTYTGFTLQDPDAENEVFKVTANLSGAMTGARDAPALIEDDETQRYVLTLDTAAPTEGAPIEATLAADPAHEDGVSRTTLKLRLDEPRYSLDAGRRWTRPRRPPSRTPPEPAAAPKVFPDISRQRKTAYPTQRRTRSRCGRGSSASFRGRRCPGPPRRAARPCRRPAPAALAWASAYPTRRRIATVSAPVASTVPTIQRMSRVSRLAISVRTSAISVRTAAISVRCSARDSAISVRSSASPALNWSGVTWSPCSAPARMAVAMTSACRRSTPPAGELLGDSERVEHAVSLARVACRGDPRGRRFRRGP